MTGSRLSSAIDGRIFVVGVPRSGTTLVQALLAAHGAVASFTESHLFDRHFVFLPGLGRPILTRDPGPRLREFLAENGEEAPAAAEEFAAAGGGLRGWRPLLPLRTGSVARRLLRVLDELTLRRGRAVWVEKTPRHLRYVPFLEGVAGPAGGARFVHVVREGLETVASLRAASRGWERPYDLAACVRRWNRDIAFSARRLASPSDHFVVYEELAARPEAVLRTLLGELGLVWEPEILERYPTASERLVTGQERGWKGDVGRAIRPAPSSSSTLSEEERRRATRSLRREPYERIRGRPRSPVEATPAPGKEAGVR